MVLGSWAIVQMQAAGDNADDIGYMPFPISVNGTQYASAGADYCFGINGIVTFKNSNLRERIPTIGLDRLLLETDSPYLAPVPHRGKRNESAYITHTAAECARALDIEPEQLARATTANAAALFALDL